jgi:hypothetical protein
VAAALSLVGAASATGGEVNLRAVPGVSGYGSGHQVPLRSARPSWYTAALSAKVRPANGQPVAAPTDSPLPSEVGIRPGAWILEP